MVHNNKVLTVSYGTFSCTLEGFEDSFGTMKAIAEYFRDLASDDRYFGAEPPQPDAEMLARIAQREVARQVEARTSSEGIHLRAAMPAVTAPASASEPATPAPQTSLDTTPSVEPSTENAPVAYTPAEDTAEAITPHLEDGADDVSDDVVDEAGDIDLSAVELFEEPPTAEATETTVSVEAPAEQVIVATASVKETNPEIPETAANDAIPDTAVDMATIAAISAAVAQNETPPQVSEIEIFDPATTESNIASSFTPESDHRPGATEDTVPAVDSIAAKLQRIRAVVAQTPVEEFSEDEHAEAFVEAVAAELSQEEDEADEILGADEADDDEITRALDRLDLNGDLVAKADETVAEQQDPNMSSTETADTQTEAREEDPEAIVQGDGILFSDLDEADDNVQTGAEEITTPRRRVRISRLRKPAEEERDLDAAPPAASLAAEADKDVPAEIDAHDDTTVAQPSPVGEDSSVTPQPRPRIVKMKRLDLEKAVAAGGLEEVIEDADEPQPRPVDPIESTLDEDDEADLMRELAQVEADLLASTQTRAQTQEPAAEVVQQPSEPVFEPEIEQRPAATSPDSDVSRLMAAAETKLDDPDNATSRETYSQLRAAVAAAEADRTAGGTVVSADDAEPYRADLANVVRPRRPGAEATKPARPRASADRPAPLKLVAEQRIDAVVAASDKPVRPRRISVHDDEATVQQREIPDTFADYARDRGAAELHELLEAAAAYMSFVEGRDHFSRPQLMNKVRNIGSTDFNREDGLRSFGQLLRDGKIERAENGRFAATQDIGFRPEKRAAG